MASIPVIPYLAKNLIISATGIGFIRYLLAAWPIQLVFASLFVTISGFYAQKSDYLWISLVVTVVVIGVTLRIDRNIRSKIRAQ